MAEKPNAEVSIGYLADHLAAIPRLTEWFVQEWPVHYGTGGPGDARTDLLAYCQRDHLPLGLVALDHQGVLGFTVLKRHSITSRPHLEPWLAAFVVDPSNRGRGIGTLLIHAVERAARDFGFDRVYTGTHVHGLFLRCGWEWVEEIDYHGERVGILTFRLAQEV